MYAVLIAVLLPSSPVTKNKKAIQEGLHCWVQKRDLRKVAMRECYEVPHESGYDSYNEDYTGYHHNYL